MRMFTLYLLKLFQSTVSTFIRNFRTPPDYVTFLFEGEHPLIIQPRSKIPFHLFRPQKLSISEFSSACSLIKKDPSVKGIIIYLRTLQIPFGTLDAIRDNILDLRERGKKVVSWSTEYDQPRYYIACACDLIMLIPGGLIYPLGFQRGYLFLADALQKVGIDAQYVPISPYKSAGDMMTRTSFSKESKAMHRWLFNSSYKHFISKIIEGRKISSEKIDGLIDNTPCHDLEAKQHGLIDEILNMEDIPHYLSDEKSDPVKVNTWSMSRPFIQKEIPDYHEKYIALMSIEGAIIEGRSRQPLFSKFTLPFPFGLSKCAGDISVTATIKKIENDKSVSALLLYINSGGGSAAASEVMRSALEKLAKKIPVFVVMGPMAASGGYWIATAAYKIFAYPNTLTGSIGVLSGKFILKGFLKKLHLHREVIKQGKHSLMFSSDTHFNDEQITMLKNYIQRVYDLFLDRVSKCRKIDRKTVDSIAQGKVWTGLQALENGLIDGTGGFKQAINEIQKTMGLKPSTPIQIIQPPRKNLLAAAAADSMICRYLNIVLKGERSMTALCLCPFVEEY